MPIQVFKEANVKMELGTQKIYCGDIWRIKGKKQAQAEKEGKKENWGGRIWDDKAVLRKFQWGWEL